MKKTVWNEFRRGPPWISDGWMVWLLLPPKSNLRKIVQINVCIAQIDCQPISTNLSSSENLFFQPNLITSWASAFECGPSQPWETHMDGVDSWRCIIFPSCKGGAEVNQDKAFVFRPKIYVFSLRWSLAQGITATTILLETGPGPVRSSSRPPVLCGNSWKSIQNRKLVVLGFGLFFGL